MACDEISKGTLSETNRKCLLPMNMHLGHENNGCLYKLLLL